MIYGREPVLEEDWSWYTSVRLREDDLEEGIPCGKGGGGGSETCLL